MVQTIRFAHWDGLSPHLNQTLAIKEAMKITNLFRTESENDLKVLAILDEIEVELKKIGF